MNTSYIKYRIYKISYHARMKIIFRNYRTTRVCCDTNQSFINKNSNLWTPEMTQAELKLTELQSNLERVPMYLRLNII